jgi:hypothetical protein
MNKFGLEEIRAIRDRWDDMPYEEAMAERRKLAASAKRYMTRLKNKRNAKNKEPLQTV